MGFVVGDSSRPLSDVGTTIRIAHGQVSADTVKGTLALERDWR